MCSECRDSVLHITDLHFWHIPREPWRWLGKRGIGLINVWARRSREYRTERAASFAKALAETGARTVLATGDVSSTALEHEFEQAAAFFRNLEQDGLRVFTQPGNHDVYTRNAFRTQRFQRMLAVFWPGAQLPARVGLPGGTDVVFAPTVCPDWAARGYISDDDAQETARLVQEAAPGPVLVAAHYPVLNTTTGYHSIFTRRLRNAESLRQALGRTGRTILYCAGHVHRLSLTQDQDYPSVHYLTTPALFKRKHDSTDGGAFSEIRVLANGFEVYAHSFEQGAWQARLVHAG